MEPELKRSSFPDWYLVDRAELEGHSPSSAGDAATSTASTPSLTHTGELGSSVTITRTALLGTLFVSAGGVPGHLGGGPDEKARLAKVNAEELQDAIETASHLKYHSFQGSLASISSPMSDCDDDDRGSQLTTDSHTRTRTMSRHVFLLLAEPNFMNLRTVMIPPI
jgi:hypothetical protein